MDVKSPLRFRKLRLACLIMGGIVSVLLVAMWLRSYRWGSTLQGAIGSERVQITSEKGKLIVLIYPNLQYAGFPSRAWTFTNNPPLGSWTVWRFSQMPTGGIEVVVPYWALVLLSAVVTGTSWFRLPLRFSLRSLLIATTVVAVLVPCLMMSISAVRKSGIQTDQIKLGMTHIQLKFNFPENWMQFIIHLRTVDILGFELQSTRLGLYVTIPYWFPILVTVAPAVAAWRRWPHRFNGRTLLITFVLAAIASGTIILINQ